MSDGRKGLLAVAAGVGFAVVFAIVAANLLGPPGGGNIEPGYMREPDRR